MEKFDLVVIGAGPGGYVAAIRAAQLGMKVACIEKHVNLGGTCLNVGCIPSKSLLKASGYVRSIVEKNIDWGVFSDDVYVDLDKMHDKKNAIISDLSSGIEYLFRKNKVTLFHGTASFINYNEVAIVGDNEDSEYKTIYGEKFIIATGSKPFNLSNVPIDGQIIISSTHALNLKEPPSDLVIIGAGAIGLEIGSIWSRLGSNVTVIEASDNILPNADIAISTEARKILASQNINFITGYMASKVKDGDRENNIYLVLKPNNENKSLMQIGASNVLVAVGRKPNTKNLMLNKTNIELTEHGFIKVDDNFQTNQPHIYAIGDVIGGQMLAHKAEQEAIAVVEHFAGNKVPVPEALIPSVVYTDPEIAWVGFSEEELVQKGVEYEVGVFPMKANSRARATGEADGFVKILAHRSSRKILGAHIIASGAGDLLAEIIAVMKLNGTTDDIAHAPHSHPSLSEAIKEAALATFDKPLHI